MSTITTQRDARSPVSTIPGLVLWRWLLLVSITALVGALAVTFATTPPAPGAAAAEQVLAR
jgi:uncharacterized protein involved in exopolysaccharide biosynthesis